MMFLALQAFSGFTTIIGLFPDTKADSTLTSTE